MIVVIEGISAAGKSTYAKQFGEAHWVPEFPEQHPLPADSEPAQVHAAYWIEHNVRRFQAALKAEAQHGFAICDTDPFKSHFDWSMARASFKPFDVFNAAMPIAREAFAQKRLGFANRYLVKRIAPDVARAQKEGDNTRTRRRFDMHLALQPHLMDWFEAMADIFPGRVDFAFPDKSVLLEEIKNKTPEDDPRRFDVSMLDALIERLPV